MSKEAPIATMKACNPGVVSLLGPGESPYLGQPGGLVHAELS